MSRRDPFGTSARDLLRKMPCIGAEQKRFPGGIPSGQHDEKFAGIKLTHYRRQLTSPMFIFEVLHRTLVTTLQPSMQGHAIESIGRRHLGAGYIVPDLSGA